MKKYNIAIVGATGLVGSKCILLLEEYKIPINKLFLYASKKSVGIKIKVNNQYYEVKEIKEEDFDEIDFVLMAAGNEVSKKYGLLFEQKGCIVIDNSSFFRMEKDIPLVVPEINYSAIDLTKRRIIANPNCATIQAVVCLNQIKNVYTLKKVIYNTYQAVSGSGMKGIFDYQSALEGFPKEFYPFDITKTCIPFIGELTNNGFTSEEIKMINETKKILALPSLEVIANCVRVPVLNCHGVSVYVETNEEVDINKIIDSFNNEKSIIYLNEDIPNGVICDSQDKIFVGRLRKCNNNSVIFYCVGDNIRKGAAANALQILSKIIYEKEKI